MSKSMTYQIVSQDPENYNTVSFNPTIPWNTHRVQYKITNINTFSNFLITTDDDYIEFDTTPGDPRKFTCFKNKTSWELEEIVKILNEELPLITTITDIMLLRRPHGSKTLLAILTVKPFKNLSPNTNFSSTVNSTIFIG